MSESQVNFLILLKLIFLLQGTQVFKIIYYKLFIKLYRELYATHIYIHIITDKAYGVILYVHVALKVVVCTRVLCKLGGGVSRLTEDDAVPWHQDSQEIFKFLSFHSDK